MFTEMIKRVVFILITMGPIIYVNADDEPQTRKPRSTVGDFVFDGVDYEILEDPLKKNYYNCYGVHLQCIRFNTYLSPICAATMDKKWAEFSNICEMLQQNCLYREENGYDIQGGDFRQDKYFFSGEYERCQKWKLLRDLNEEENSVMLSKLK